MPSDSLYFMSISATSPFAPAYSAPSRSATSNAGALVFWRKLGYVETGEVKRAGSELISDVIVLEKPSGSDPVFFHGSLSPE